MVIAQQNSSEVSLYVKRYAYQKGSLCSRALNPRPLKNRC